MSLVHDEFASADSASAAAPLGWRLGMALCNLLIGVTILGLAGIAVYEFRGIALY